MAQQLRMVIKTLFRTTRHFLCLVVLSCGLCWQGPTFAQDLEPRRWSHLPVGINAVGIGTSYLDGDIFVDPVLEIEDANTQVLGFGGVYLRSFDFFGKSARFDLRVPYVNGRWEGILQGRQASTRRQGFGDPRLRVSVLLWGGPALSKKEFAQAPKSNTIVGAAFSLGLPWGEYEPERLINIGNNRMVFRPQLGVTHTRGKWTYELTGSAFIYGDNDEFSGDRRLKQDPIWAIQGHVIYTFRPGLWASFSSAYGAGGESSVDGVSRNNKVGNWLTSLAVGIPINRQQGMKLTWLRTRTQEPVGIDLDSLAISWQFVF